MTVLRTAYVNVLPKTDNFDPELKKRLGRIDASKSGERVGGSFGGGFTRAMGGAVAGLGAVFAGLGVVNFFKDAIAEQRESIRVGNLTNQVLKSTGGAAKVTAGQVGDLATALSNKAGVDDELIQSGENVLLTFTNIRNEVGKGNDVFNQATGLALDMSTALGTDLQGSVIQVGKALNDPIKGVTALQRVGVSFTAQQKEQIKNFVDSGNIMGAQKVILKELATEFGGAAAAAASPAEKAKVAWGNFKETIGGLVLPIVGKLANFFTGTLLPVLQDKVIPFVQMVGSAFKAAFSGEGVTSSGFIGFVERLGVLLGSVAGQARAFWTGLTEGAGQGAGILQQLGDVVRTYVIPAILTLGDWIGKAVGWLTSGSEWAGLLRSALAGAAAAILVVAGALKVWAGIQAILNILLTANPIGLVILAIGALVAGVIYAWTHFAGFREVVITVWDALKTGALAVWSVLQPVFQAIGAAVLWLWQNVIQPSFQGWALLFRTVVGPVVMWLWHNIIQPAFDGIGFAAQIAISIITTVFGAWMAYIRNVVVPTVLWLWHNIFEPSFRGMWAIIQTAWGVIRPILAALRDFVVNDLAPRVQQGIDAMGRAWESLKNLARAPVAFVVNSVINPGIIRPWNTIAGIFGGKKIPELSFASGGYIRGPGTERSDSIAAWLSRGEFVLPAKTVRQIGVGRLNRLIGKPSAARPGDGSEGIAFADGGLVGDIIGLFTNPAEKLGGPVKRLLGGIPGQGLLRDLLVNMGGQLVKLFTAWVGGGGGGGDVGKAQAFIRGQAGKPYVWASAGPGGYDCSGIVSAVWNLMHGRSPYSHTFSTMDEARYFPQPGPGVFTAAWANASERGGGSVGHTAAMLAGLPFESRGGAGVVVGPGVTSLGSFAHLGHYATGGIVPGPYGTPRPAIVHGGEEIRPPGPVELSDRSLAKLARALSGMTVVLDGRAVGRIEARTVDLYARGG